MAFSFISNQHFFLFMLLLDFLKFLYDWNVPLHWIRCSCIYIHYFTFTIDVFRSEAILVYKNTPFSQSFGMKILSMTILMLLMLNLLSYDKKYYVTKKKFEGCLTIEMERVIMNSVIICFDDFEGYKQTRTIKSHKLWKYHLYVEFFNNHETQFNLIHILFKYIKNTSQ